MKKQKRRDYILYRYHFYLILLLLCVGVGDIGCFLWLLVEKENPFAAVGVTGIYLFLLFILYRRIYKRYREIQKECRLFVEGYLSDEFLMKGSGISPLLAQVAEILSDRLDKEKHLNVAKKQAQYLALQNQIHPHFLYNTLEGIRSEALCAGMDAVAEMAEALATFFRYTISNLDRLVTLEDELENIENYYIIQQFRFGEKLSLKIEYEDEMEALELKVPKLTLQPIVENSIYHGIERKIGKGSLKIKIGTTGKLLRILVSDDGLGVEKEKLEKLNRKLLTASLEDVLTENEQKGGIALINVNNRIKLLFGEQYGIHLYSVPDLGTDVEITLPVIREEEI